MNRSNEMFPVSLFLAQHINVRYYSLSSGLLFDVGQGTGEEHVKEHDGVAPQ